MPSLYSPPSPKPASTKDEAAAQVLAALGYRHTGSACDRLADLSQREAVFVYGWLEDHDLDVTPMPEWT